LKEDEYKTKSVFLADINQERVLNYFDLLVFCYAGADPASFVRGDGSFPEGLNYYGAFSLEIFSKSEALNAISCVSI
jgi:hypothetical protein